MAAAFSISRRTYTEKGQKVRHQSEYNQELETLRRKYELLFQEEESSFLRTKSRYDDLIGKLAANQSLAEELGAKLMVTSESRGGVPSPPLQQPPQASQQVPVRSPPVATTASPIAPTAAARPPMPTPLPLSRPRVQPSQVAGLVRPSSSVSPGNLVRPTARTTQYLPARLWFTSKTLVAPVTPVDLTASSSHPATLPPSSSRSLESPVSPK